MSKATIEITADVARYQAELAKIPGMTDKAAARAALKMEKRLSAAAKNAAKEAEKAAESATKAASKVTQFSESAELLERMRAALGPLGDSFGDLTGGADDLGTALEGFSVKQIAAAAGAIVVAAALVKVGSAVTDVIFNLEEYEDQIERLQAAGDLTAGQVEGLREASAAVDTLQESFGSLAVLIAADVAPLMESFMRGIAVLPSLLTGGWAGATEAAGKFNARMKEVSEESEKLRKEDAAAKAAKSSKAAASDARKAWKAYTDQFGSFADELQEFTTANASMDDLLTESILRPSSALDAINLKYDTMANNVMELALETGRLADAEIILADIEQRRLKDLDDARKKAHEAEAKRREKAQRDAEQKAEAFAKHQLEMQSAAFNSAASVAGSIHSSLDSVIAMIDTSTAAGKKAARQMAATQKALAIFQIGINMATSISQALAQGGPVAGAAMAAAVVAAFAGIMAEVSAPDPAVPHRPVRRGVGYAGRRVDDGRRGHGIARGS